ncbi:MAG: aldo/keto reductase [Negativicutes bacterium]|nr:aldo/keto reductase [Negativicutes bacterium]
MEYSLLGRTGLNVSRLCFGAFTIGPLQAKLPLRSGSAIIRAALAAGVNFIDTAELYGSYPYIREAIKGYDGVVIASKSYAYTYEDMRRSVEDALCQLGRDYIDIFLLHEQVSRHTLRGHHDALVYLLDAKSQGLVRAVGVSTHAVEVVQVAAAMPEIDVIHPILNSRGVGILDGSAVDMLAAVHAASVAGKGIYTMKALGGGHLIPEAPQALSWVLGQSGISAVAVGMQTKAEVALNCSLFSGQAADEAAWVKARGKKRRLIVEDHCTGCGKCAARCRMGAITVGEGKAVPDPARCVLCGYCGAVCPDFCLKII